MYHSPEFKRDKNQSVDKKKKVIFVILWVLITVIINKMAKKV